MKKNNTGVLITSLIVAMVAIGIFATTIIINS